MSDFQPGARVWLASDDEYPFRLGTVVAPPKSLDLASRRVHVEADGSETTALASELLAANPEIQDDCDDIGRLSHLNEAALLHLAKVAAKEGAADRIRVNAIAPAGVETPVWDAVPMFADRVAEIGRDAAFAELAAMGTPLGRYAKAEEVAEQIAFLLSDQSALITGTTLLADGGYTL